MMDFTIYGRSWSFVFFRFKPHPFSLVFREGGRMLPGGWNFTFNMSHWLPFRVFLHWGGKWGWSMEIMKQVDRRWAVYYTRRPKPMPPESFVKFADGRIMEISNKLGDLFPDRTYVGKRYSVKQLKEDLRNVLKMGNDEECDGGGPG